MILALDQKHRDQIDWANVVIIQMHWSSSDYDIHSALACFRGPSLNFSVMSGKARRNSDKTISFAAQTGISHEKASISKPHQIASRSFQPFSMVFKIALPKKSPFRETVGISR